MRLKVFFFTLLLAFSSAEAQRFNGFIYSDFSGILGARVQPASIAGSPYKWDVSLINGDAFITNNIGKLERNGETSTITRFIDDKTKFLQANASVGGISAMLSLPNNQAIGIQYQLRAQVSANNITPDFVSQVNRFTDARFLNSTTEDQSGELAAAVWRELSFTYAKVVHDDGYNRWKFGVTAKMINTYGGAYVKLNDLDYDINGQGLAQFTNWQMDFGYSFNLDPFDGFNGNEQFNGLPPKNKYSSAYDIGVVFERRASRAPPKTAVGTRLEPDVDYEFRVSASLIDIGRMKFTQGLASTRVRGIDPGITGPLDLDQLLDGVDDAASLAQTFDTFTDIETIPGTFTLSLPTTLNLNFDYNFGNDWWINANGLIDASGLMPTDLKLNYLSNLTITPRWEQSRKAVYMPVYINQIGDFHLGLAARLGVLTLGTQNLGSLFAPERTNFGFFFTLNINKLVANSQKPYCFGTGRGSGMTRTKRTPLYKRKKFLFF